MFKKTLLLGSTALALVAFVVPASASASGMFLHEGNEITETKEVEFTGHIGFKLGGNGFMCHAHATAEIETNGGSIASTENGGIQIGECEGTGQFAGCTVSEASSETALSLTPTTHVEGGENKGDIDISNVHIFNAYEGALCPLVEATVTSDPSAPVTATPNNSNAISSLTLSGPVVVDLVTVFGPQEVTSEATGELNATPAGTIGIAE